MTCVETFGYICLYGLLLKILFVILKFVYVTHLAHRLNSDRKWLSGKNKWAIVTGATDGIGLEYAKKLANHSYNLLLISRNPEKLESTKTQIQSECKKVGEIRTLSYDFTKADGYSVIEKELKNLSNMHVLVNNVGISYQHPEYFTQIPNWKSHEDIINVNVVACTKMMYLVLPTMEKQKEGVIINISSTSGDMVTPLLSSYSASKAYMDFLSRSLAMEYEKSGIIIQSVLPAFVATKMSKVRRATLTIPTPYVYVDSAFKSIGVEKRTFAFWAHRVQQWVLHTLDCCYPDLASSIAFSQLKSLRQKALKKKAEKGD